MFGSRRGGTVIGNGLKIVGSVTAEGLVEVNGQVEGDLHCTSLIISPTAQIVGSITAEQVVVDGKVANLFLLRRAPTLMAARHRPMEQTVANPTEQREEHFGRAARLMLQLSSLALPE